MKSLLVDRTDQIFNLFDVENAPLENPASCEDSYRDFMTMTLDEAAGIASEKVFPALQSGDREGCRLENGEVRVPASFHPLKKIFDNGGWSSMSLKRESGGQGFSMLQLISVSEWFAHNPAFFVYTNQHVGAGTFIEQFGSPEQKTTYLPGLVSGRWGGPVSLTEPEAGSDLDMINTTAKLNPDGSYSISGTKAMVSNADADLFENTICIVPARTEDAPEGKEGVSLFLIPKYYEKNPDEKPVRNDYVITGIDEKMGLNGWATCSIAFGDNGECYGEIIGEKNRGIEMLLQLVSKQQMRIALKSLGIASSAYLHALDYAKKRKQGTSLQDAFTPGASRICIVDHPDVKHMLLYMKSIVEGMRGLIYHTASICDISDLSKNKEEQKKAAGLFNLLYPICRTVCSEKGFLVTDKAMQVHGGCGYNKGNPVEQYMRDLKPATIYEGANGIQSLIFLTDKFVANNGEYFQDWMEKMYETIREGCEFDKTVRISETFRKKVDMLAEVAQRNGTMFAEGNFETPVSGATAFLRMAGVVALGWSLLRQSIIACKKASGSEKEKWSRFSEGKRITATFFMSHILPEVDTHYASITSNDTSISDMTQDLFMV